jgi:hypothetical protein
VCVQQTNNVPPSSLCLAVITRGKVFARKNLKSLKASMNFNVPTVNMSLKDNDNHSSCFPMNSEENTRIVEEEKTR